MAEEAEQEEVKPTPRRCSWKNVEQFFVNHFLIFAILAGLILGIVAGVAMKHIREDGIYTKREVMYVVFIGNLYIRALKLVALPLVIASIVDSLAGLSLRFAGLLGLRTFIFYLASNILAVFWGLILVYIIQPGKDAVDFDLNTNNTYVQPFTVVDSLLDLIRSIFPNNLIGACIYTTHTELTPPVVDTLDENGSAVTNPDGTVEQTIDWSVPLMEWSYTQNIEILGTNYLGLCMTSIAFGIAAIVITGSTPIVRELFKALNEIILAVVTVIIWASPIGVLSLIAGKIIEEKDWSRFVGQVGWFSFTIIIGIVTYGFVVLPLLYLALTRKNPITFTFHMTEAVITGFATASSVATLPITLRCVIDKSGISPIVARFVVSVGATFNMNGTSLYEAVAPIFIAQALKKNLSSVQIILTCIVAMLASFGASGIPQAGIVTLVMTLAVLNLEPETIASLVAVDWLLDRFRTALNVFGDAVAAAVVYSFSQKAIQEMVMGEMQTK